VVLRYSLLRAYVAENFQLLLGKRTTETAGARSEPPIRIVTAIAMFRQLRERRGTNSSILPAV